VTLSLSQLHLQCISGHEYNRHVKSVEDMFTWMRLLAAANKSDIIRLGCGDLLVDVQMTQYLPTNKTFGAVTTSLRPLALCSP